MISFHIIYLSSQDRGLVTHGSLIEVIFQNKAPFFNEKPMNIGVWVLKFGHVWTQIRKVLPCCKNHRDSHPPPPWLPTYSWQMLSKKHSNIVEFFEFYEVATFHPMWPEWRGGKKTNGFNHFLFLLIPGEMIQFDEHKTTPTSLKSFLFCCFKTWQWCMVYFIWGYVSLCQFWDLFLNEWTSSWDKPRDLSCFLVMLPCKFLWNIIPPAGIWRS